MVSSAFRGVVALTAAIVIATPAWAQLDAVTAWLERVPQPSALVLFLVAVGGVLVGRFASRRRREP
ncbi:MAG: PEP-CTERM sorting domain-containing protein [Pseudomonadota bacterium]